jgi:hypothetical protein
LWGSLLLTYLHLNKKLVAIGPSLNTSSSSGTSSQDVDPEVVTPNGYSLLLCSDGALDLKIVDQVYGSVVAVRFIVPRMMAIGFSLWIDNLLP